MDLDPRDEKDQYMKPWDDKDVSRLKVEIVVEKEEKSSADPAIQIERDNVLSQVSRKEKRHEQ